jgi:hypothetical protein
MAISSPVVNTQNKHSTSHAVLQKRRAEIYAADERTDKLQYLQRVCFKIEAQLVFEFAFGA